MATFLSTKKALFAALLSVGLVSNAGAATTNVVLDDASIAAGAYSKSYTFTIAAGEVGTLGGFLESWSLDSDGFYGFNLLGATLSYTSATNFTSTTTIVPDALDTETTFYNYTTTFGATNLAAGSYTLKVKGIALSSDSSVAGAYNLVTTAVPEPSSYALMLVGLGFVGFASLRRQA